MSENIKIHKRSYCEYHLHPKENSMSHCRLAVFNEPEGSQKGLHVEAMC